MLEWILHGNLCRTIGPLLSQRFLLASAKAQPRGGFIKGCEVKQILYPLGANPTLELWSGFVLPLGLLNESRVKSSDPGFYTPVWNLHPLAPCSKYRLYYSIIINHLRGPNGRIMTQSNLINILCRCTTYCHKKCHQSRTFNCTT